MTAKTTKRKRGERKSIANRTANLNEQKFAIEWLTNGNNASVAYQVAYNNPNRNSAAVLGTKCLARPAVQKYIAEQQELLIKHFNPNNIALLKKYEFLMQEALKLMEETDWDRMPGNARISAIKAITDILKEVAVLTKQKKDPEEGAGMIVNITIGENLPPQITIKSRNDS